ncbi:RsfA family transcriptional regulator [Caldalkalibacillus salinus]|uniref:RsfA family transcriptional regulator n=1 Tax=Caldalkalibacillus salinus TaxID=2803787 RepID=UPI0019241284|nr:RsfA family transcriptional regulator [Caldalkalibacillus salinus]
MTATRQDAWSEDDDLLLAEVVLRHIREGSTQLNAFEEVGQRLSRTAAACGFRWNSLVRKKYESAIQIAKAQRQQRKAKGKKRFFTEQDEGMMTQPEETYAMNGASTPYEQEISDISVNSGSETTEDSIDFDQVIRFLRSHKDSFKRVKQMEKELQEKEDEIQKLREENEKMRHDLGSVQNDYQTMNEDYRALIKIMDRARKLAFLGEEQEEKMSFKMDKNGNLERVEK